jgi:DNA-binding NtrC family response regulator
VTAPVAARILVVDDDPGVVAFLSEMLVKRDYAVVGETSPVKALARIGQERFDLVIADVEMPELRGLDLLRQIQAKKPQQLVMLITAFGSIDLAVESVRAGACDFITKPFKIGVIYLAIERALREREMLHEITRLRVTRPEFGPSGMVARSPAMLAAIDIARRAAQTTATVLLTGETGTGKSALARLIHDTGPRASGPFTELNCAALPTNLIESELFGVRKGAFTDARENREGLLVSARGGTLFLDEIGELPVEAQAKLLQVLESGRVRALGATSDHPIDARLVAATNQRLEDLLRQGRFRPDLYYRLNVIRIDLPPLRERREDILPLVDLLLQRTGSKLGRPIVAVSATALRKLLAYEWPGNIRELANLIERAVALAQHDTLLPEDFDLAVPSAGSANIIEQGVQQGLSLEKVEKAYMRRMIEEKGGNKAAAARALGINRRKLYRKLS